MSATSFRSSAAGAAGEQEECDIDCGAKQRSGECAAKIRLDGASAGAASLRAICEACQAKPREAEDRFLADHDRVLRGAVDELEAFVRCLRPGSVVLAGLAPAVERLAELSRAFTMYTLPLGSGLQPTKNPGERNPADEIVF